MVTMMEAWPQQLAPYCRDMNVVRQPWRLLVVILVGRFERQQLQIIEFQNEQIKALLERQGKKRILLTADQRRRLAVKGKALGRKALTQVTEISRSNKDLRAILGPSLHYI